MRPEVLTQFLMTSRLYWIGLYEERDAKKWEWFFQVDLAPAIGYFTKRAVGGGQLTQIFDSRMVLVLTRITVMGVLASLRGILAISSLSSLPVFLLAHFVSHVPLDAWLGIYVAFAVCAHFLWHSVGVPLYATASNVDGRDLLLDPTSTSSSLGMAMGNALCR
jgi:hypothetical protein